MPKPGYNTKPVTLRMPGVIREEIYKRIDGDYGQTEVILEALCRAFGIPHPRPYKPKVKVDEQNHDTKAA